MKKKDKYIGGIIIALLIVIVGIISYFKSQPKSYKDEDIFVDVPVSSETKSTTTTSESNGKIVVEIKGEVKNPDVYMMDSDDIVKDLIVEADGITENGDLSNVNQAMALKKGDCITIPSKVDDNAISTESQSAQPSGTSTQSAKTPSGKIDANRASKEELKSVPGIGDVTAEKIIEYREKNGPFGSFDDLKKIDRIGEATLKKFQDYLEVR